MKHSSAPAYSMGLKYPAEPITTNKLAPSPNTYNLREIETTVPAPVFSKASRDPIIRKSESPGPGAYKIATFVDLALSTPGGKIPKPKDKSEKQKIEGPGPASYNAQKPKASISFSMGSKVFSLPSSNQTYSTSPDRYNPNYDSIKPVKHQTFSKALREEKPSLEVPGPGSYFVAHYKDAPIYGFPREERGRRPASNVPAPGEYEIPGLSDELKKKPGKTMGWKREVNKYDNEVPGPGFYQAKYPNESPSFSVGKDKRHDLVSMRKSPGPGEYDIPGSLANSPAKSIGSSIRQPIYNKNTFPGPGAYEAPSFTAMGPKYSLVARRTTSNDSSVPGPGHYNPEYKIINGHAFSVVIGSQKKNNSSEMKYPGPGTYEAKDTSESPKWSFKKASLDKQMESDEPGPGHYEFNSSVPDVPKYLMFKKK